MISKSGASGIAGDDVSYVIVEDLTVKNSGGPQDDGGGIRITGSNNVTLQSCRATGNTATNGGGILVSGSNVVVNHCLADHNVASNIGGGIVVESGSTGSITNVTAANNSWQNALHNGGVGGIDVSRSNVQITKSIAWDNNDQDFSGSGSGVSDSDIGNWSGSGTNDIASDPAFVSTTDYHLQATSPAAGMGAY